MHAKSSLPTTSSLSLDEFFAGEPISRQLFDRIQQYLTTLGSFETRVTKSQVSFRRYRPFAWVWMPGKYLHRQVAPLVLTFVFDYRDKSPRWKEIVAPAPGHFTHHLELYSLSDIDGDVEGWLKQAWVDGAMKKTRIP